MKRLTTALALSTLLVLGACDNDDDDDDGGSGGGTTDGGMTDGGMSGGGTSGGGGDGSGNDLLSIASRDADSEPPALDAVMLGAEIDSLFGDTDTSESIAIEADDEDAAAVIRRRGGSSADD